MPCFSLFLHTLISCWNSKFCQTTPSPSASTFNKMSDTCFSKPSTHWELVDLQTTDGSGSGIPAVIWSSRLQQCHPFVIYITKGWHCKIFKGRKEGKMSWTVPGPICVHFLISWDQCWLSWPVDPGGFSGRRSRSCLCRAWRLLLHCRCRWDGKWSWNHQRRWFGGPERIKERPCERWAKKC